MERLVWCVVIPSALCGIALACSENEAPAATDPEPAPQPAPADPIPAAPEEGAPARGADTDQAGTEEETQAEAQPQVEDQSDLECENEDVVCPTFEWMEANTVPAVENADLPALAAAFHKIEFMSPVPAWNEGEQGWAQISRRGAELAEKGDFRESRKMCKGCHEKWRDEFRRQYRLQPLPELPPNASAGRTDL